MIITLKGWYQIDFALPNVSETKTTLLKIVGVMGELEKEQLVDSWFFLFEGDKEKGDSIRVRMQSNDKNALQKQMEMLSSKNGLAVSEKLPFSEYQEGDEMLFNEQVVEAFAKVMSEVTKLTIAKLTNGVSFNSYRVLERRQHCMFNNMLTLKFKSEEHFLQQRFLERTGQVFDSDFEA